MTSKQNNMKNVALIGFGEMGKRLAEEVVVASTGLVEIVAVVEPKDEKYEVGCAWVKKEPKRYADIKSMLGDLESKKLAALDGVMIASPNHCHLENLKHFEEFDIPILLEKPLDSTWEKICEIVRFSERYKGRIVVDHVMRYAPILQKAKELLEAGAIGKLCSANFEQNCFYGNGMYRNFRRTMEGGGGMFLEKATHDFDIMLYLLGERAESVAAISKMQAFGGDKPADLICCECEERITCPESVTNVHRRYGDKAMRDFERSEQLCVFSKSIDVPDNQTCMIDFSNGVFGTYTQCFFSPSSYFTREYELLGLEGAMRIILSLPEDHNKGKIMMCPRFGTPEDVFEYNFDYRDRIHYNGGGYIAKHFYQMLEGKAEPFTTVKQAFVAEAIGYAATLAAKDKRIVGISEIIPDDLKDM